MEWKVNDAGEIARIFGLIGVPSTAGAHYPGQEKAPVAVRGAGLATRLAGAGISILNYGDYLRSAVVFVLLPETSIESLTFEPWQQTSQPLSKKSSPLNKPR